MSYQFVKIYYGPYQGYYTIIDKPLKLQGIIRHLRENNFRVKCILVQERNVCIIELCGHEVFRCNIAQLRTNSPAILDPVAARAVNAVITSRELLLEANQFFWTKDCLLNIKDILKNKYMFKNEWLRNSWYFDGQKPMGKKTEGSIEDLKKVERLFL